MCAIVLDISVRPIFWFCVCPVSNEYFESVHQSVCAGYRHDNTNHPQRRKLQRIDCNIYMCVCIYIYKRYNIFDYIHWLLLPDRNIYHTKRHHVILWYDRVCCVLPHFDSLVLAIWLVVVIVVVVDSLSHTHVTYHHSVYTFISLSRISSICYREKNQETKGG